MDDIKEVANIDRLENEYDLHKASLLESKLRLLIEENPDLKPIRKKLRDLIKDYEDRNWLDLDKITDAQIEISDKAEEIIDYEQRFIQKRKDNIRKKLKEFDMTPTGFGNIIRTS